MKARLLFVLTATLVLLGFHYYAANLRRFHELSASVFVMNGVEVQIKGYDTTRKAFGKSLEDIREAFQNFEGRMSRFKADSEISRINREGADGPVPVDASTFAVLEASQAVAKVSSGAFDISCLPLLQLWKQAAKNKTLPDVNAIAAAKAKGNFQDIALDPVNRTVRIKAGMGLDLGGIAQGYFADKGAAILRQHGISRGLVNCSGEIAVFDDRKSPEPFSIAIFDPKTGSSETKVSLQQGAVSTSGNYARYVEIAGKKYSHIVDPVSGWPANRTASVTIQGPSAILADAWSTALAVIASRGEDPAKVLPPGFKVLALVVEAQEGDVGTTPAPRKKGKAASAETRATMRRR